MENIDEVADGLLADGYAVLDGCAGLWQNAIEVASAFYSLTIEQRLECHCSQTLGARGYSMAEYEYALLESEGRDVSFATDVSWAEGQRKRGYSSLDLGRQHEGEKQDELLSFLYSANVLPDTPQLVARMDALYRDFEAVAGSLMETLFRRISPETDEHGRTRAYSSMRLLKYPESGSGWSKSHSDYELFAIIACNAPGLEVLSRDGQWSPLDAPDGSMVVLAGDCLQSISGKRVVAAQHRVALGHERLSVPFFQGLPTDYALSEIDMTFGQHVASRLIRSFPHLRIAHEEGRLLPNLKVSATNPFHADTMS